MRIDNYTLGSLEGHRDKFTSHDLDEARHQISCLFKPHELNVLGRRQSLDAKVGWTNFGDTSFIYLRHGAAVNIYPGKLETFFLLQVPISGTGEVRIDNTLVDISIDMAYMMSPTFDVEMKFLKNCEHIILKVERARLESFLEQHLQRSLNAPLEFAPKIALGERQNQEMVNLITYIAKQLNQTSSNLHHAMIRPQAESLLMSSLLISLEHNYHAQLTAEVAAPRPYYIKKAQAYIQENPELPITPEDIARESCISLRSIYTGFQTYLNTTPMAYIKDAKLDRVREGLQQLEPSDASVSEIALKYGFSHFGNFAANYKKKFGELPSDTLRRTTV